MILSFDLDGTLISCEPRQSSVLRAALKRFGFSLDLDAVWSRKRNGFSTFEALRGQGLDDKSASRLVEVWRSMVEEPIWLGLDSLMPGVLETLGEVRSAGFSPVLVTGREFPKWVYPQLERLGLSAMLTDVIVVPPSRVVETKAEAMIRIGAVAHFGDTEVDARAASMAGVRFLAVSWGQRSPEYLSGLGIKGVYGDLSGAWQAFRLASGTTFGDYRDEG